MIAESPTWIDLHCHLDELEISAEEALKNAEAVKVKNVITIGTNPADHMRVLGLVDAHFPKVFGTLGVHPHDASKYSDEVDLFLRQNLSHKGIVAVGEIGLDYYYNKSDKHTQLDAFRKQMQIAADLKMPVEIHTREAEQDTEELLREFQGSVIGVLHCFTSSWWLAEKALDLGWDISISGIVTFKNAEDLREVVKRVPLDRIHVETDAPFLAPNPHRGKKNQPAFVPHTAELVAQLKGVSLTELSKQLRLNCQRLFPKMAASI